MQLVTLPFSTQSITLYNKYQGKDALNKPVVKWYKRVLENCYWGKSDSTIRVGSTVIGNDDYTVIIPQNSDFVEYAEWLLLPFDIIQTKFTINKGDIIAKGIVNDIIADNTSPTALLAKYASIAMTVRTIDNNTGIGVHLGHYKLGGV